MTSRHTTFYTAALLLIRHCSTHSAARPAHSTMHAPDWSAQSKLLGALLVCALLAPRVSSLLPVPSWTLGSPWPRVVLPAVEQPPFCSAPSKTLGSFPNTQHLPGSQSKFLLAALQPPDCSAPSLRFGPPLRCSMFWPLNVILAAKCLCSLGSSTHSWPLDAHLAVWSPLAAWLVPDS